MSDDEATIATEVLAEHRRKQREREEAERQAGLLPARSFSPDPPSDHVPETHSEIQVDGGVLMVPNEFATLDTELRLLTGAFIAKMATANGDRDWQAQLSTEYLLSARELCLKMIG